jgi:hypothetical protein
VFGYLKNTWSIRLLATYLSSLLEMNVSPMQTWRIIHDLGIVYKQPKLKLEKGDDYGEKKEKIDRQVQEDIPCSFKKRFYWDLKMKHGCTCNHT